MSVWAKTLPAGLSLEGSRGALVSVSIPVEPRRLESLLEALANVNFPINPQIYHDASLVYRFADGHEEQEATTLVDFPAYEANLPEVRATLDAYGFDSALLQVTTMLEEIHAEPHPEPAPNGAPYVTRHRVKHRAAAAV